MEIERAWLGLRTPALARRISLAGWRPDERGAYCWRCGRTIGPSEGDESGCGACRGTKVRWDRVVRLGSFEGLLREMIHEVKFTRWRRLGRDLGAMLGERVALEMDRVGIARERVVVTPVATSTWRRITRGIDHAGTIARGVAGVLEAPLIQAMTRRHGPTQRGMAVSQRRANVAQAFRALEGVDLRGRVVVLVDDVTTTRATLDAACRTLHGMRQADEEPVRIWCAVLGVTPEPGQEERARLAEEESGN